MTVAWGFVFCELSRQIRGYPLHDFRLILDAIRIWAEYDDPHNFNMVMNFGTQQFTYQQAFAADIHIVDFSRPPCFLHLQFPDSTIVTSITKTDAVRMVTGAEEIIETSHDIGVILRFLKARWDVISLSTSDVERLMA